MRQEMARGLNKIALIGFVDREQETRYTADGQPVTSFCLCNNRCWTTHSGESRQATEWFSVVTWGALARAAQERLRKNQRVYAEGFLQTRRWEDEAGRRCFRTEVVASKLIPLEDRRAIAEENRRADNKETPLCLNRVMVIGNVGRDPEMRYTPNGQEVTSFSLAATCRWTTANGERCNATEWFNVVAWGNLAEICNRYLSKGRRVYVEGELHTRNWSDADGNGHVRTELVASEMILLGPRPRSDSPQRKLDHNENESPR